MTYVEVPHQVYETTRFIVKDEAHYYSLTAEQQARIQKWATANGLDPDETVAYPVSVVTRHYPNGDRPYILYSEYLQRSDGQRYLDAYSGDIATVQRSVEQRVPFGSPC